jgi:UDP-N-acetylmuramoyl-tripeptide--D-alanyl-D-alanine ligase
MIGRYNMMNALAAATLATHFGIGPEDIASALETASPSEMRGEIIRFAGGITLVDDSYNSNPVALLSVVRALKEELEALRRVAKDELQVSRRIVIAGEMLELGPESAQMHRAVGGEIAHLDIDLLWGVRGMARELVEGARDEGMPLEMTRFFATSEEAGAALLDVVSPGDVILVKGSRGVQTDKIVKVLRESLSVLEK